MQTAIMEFFVFALVSFVGSTHYGFFMSKTTDLRIVADGWVVLIRLTDRLTRYIVYVSLFTIFSESRVHTVRSFVVFCRGQEVHCSWDDLEDP